MADLSQDFRDAMSRFASGVTIVTTRDAGGEPRGFTASAFCSLSVDPPMVLLCVGKEADSHPAFVAAEGFTVSILRPEHRDLALHFAAKGDDKFAGDPLDDGVLGMPVVADALAIVECRAADVFPGGDHTIVTGVVEHVRLGLGEPLLHYRREFWQLPPSPTPSGSDI